MTSLFQSECAVCPDCRTLIGCSPTSPCPAPPASRQTKQCWQLSNSVTLATTDIVRIVIFNYKLRSKSHTCILYSTLKSECESSSMNEFKEFDKQIPRSTWMTHYFHRDSKVRIKWMLRYPMMNRERIPELSSWSDANVAGRSRDHDKMADVWSSLRTV